MNRLEELIQELCPDGVEFKPLADCCSILDKKRKPVTKAARVEGEYPYYGANGIQDYVDDYIFDGTFVLVGEDGSVMTSSGTPVVTWAEGKIWVNNHAHIIEESRGVLLRFLFHYIQTIDVTHLIHGNIPKLTGKDFKSLSIPVPPLEVQREIVRILDTFTELTAELTAELSARKKQYEVYRDMAFNCEGCRYQKIAEIADTNIGLATSVTKHKREAGIRLLHNSDIQQNHIVLKNEEFISEEFAAKNAGKILHKNDIITVHTGDVGTSAVIDDEYDGSIGFTTITTRVKDTAVVLPQYLCHYLNSHKCKEDIASMTISDRSNLNQKNYEKLIVPIPSLEKQKRIVEMLDHFDKLSNDISEGLPAEIEARQKQYEHYRDKLLTFKEKEA